MSYKISTSCHMVTVTCDKMGHLCDLERFVLIHPNSYKCYRMSTQSKEMSIHPVADNVYQQAADMLHMQSVAEKTCAECCKRYNEAIKEKRLRQR